MSDMPAPTREHIRLRPITVGEYHRMGDAGILGPDERVELLNGRILEMPPIGPRHAYILTELYALLQRTFHGRAVVRAQQPLTLGSLSEPEPDIVIARGPSERYAAVHPTAADALLVIEVSDSMLAIDRGEKLTAYAQGGVDEYWIVNLIDRVLERFSESDGTSFQERRIARLGEFVAPRAFPNDAIAVDDILALPHGSQ